MLKVRGWVAHVIIVSPPIGLGFGTALGLGLGLKGPDLGLGLDNWIVTTHDIMRMLNFRQRFRFSIL